MTVNECYKTFLLSLPSVLLSVVNLHLHTPWGDLSSQPGALFVPLGQIQNDEDENVQKARRNSGGDIALEHCGLLCLLEQKHCRISC